MRGTAGSPNAHCGLKAIKATVLWVQYALRIKGNQGTRTAVKDKDIKNEMTGHPPERKKNEHSIIMD